MILTDESIMPFGKHKGTKMANVPAKYLMWLYYEGCNNRPVMNYIRENLDALRRENLDALRRENLDALRRENLDALRNEIAK